MNVHKHPHLRILFFMVTTVFLILACGGSATPEKIGQVEDHPPEATLPAAPPATEEAAVPTENAAPTGPEAYAVGDIVSIGDNILVILGWQNVPEDDFATPDDGKKFIAVDMVIVNQSDEAVSISTMLQMALKDETGQNYPVDFMAGMAIDESSVDGELAPGERVRGKIGFQVPIEAQGLKFVFDESLFGSGKSFINLGNTPVSLDPPVEIAGETDQQAYEVGDVVSIGDSVLAILGWADVPDGDFAKPDDGKKFIAVEMLIVNQSARPASISTMLQMAVKDSAGQSYDPDFMAGMAVDSASVDGELSPGERIRGKTGFQVPALASDLVFVFDADVFGAGKVFVNLGPQPVSVAPPAEISGETRQETFQVGDVVDIGNFTLTVNEVFSPPGDDFSQPKDGYKFVAVDVTIENKTEKAAGISSMLQMALKDATGQSYRVDLLASTATGGSTPDGELVPGEKIRGQVGYQIPVDASGLVFVFDADVFGAGKVFVALP